MSDIQASQDSMDKGRRTPQRLRCIASPRNYTNIPVPVRPKSCRNKEEPAKHDCCVRPARSNISKFTSNAKSNVTTVKVGNKTIRKNDFIAVPISQETIMNEQTEQHNIDDSDSISGLLTEEDMSLKEQWQGKLSLYENMKKELVSRQNAIIDFYGTLFSTYKGMTSLGQKADLPPVEELKIMNISKVNIEKLRKDFKDNQQKNDFGVLHNMPNDLIATCEETLNKRQEIIEWFRGLSASTKKISITLLLIKIDEFQAENDALRDALKNVKCDFNSRMDDIVASCRQREESIIDLNLRIEGLTYEISEMNALNLDLRKQLQHSETMKSQNTRVKIEGLEKELKEEKCKKAILKDKLNRAENNVAAGREKITQLETELEHAHTQIETQELRIQNLNDQNVKLHIEFNNELSRLNDLIQENTTHLEEIGQARLSLQSEKEDLEKSFEELSKSYNVTVAKSNETEQKYNKMVDEKTMLELKLKAVSKQLQEAERRYEDAYKKLQEQETMLGKLANADEELVTVKREMEIAKLEIQDLKERLNERHEFVRNLEQKLAEFTETEDRLKKYAKSKEEHIMRLEKNQCDLQKQIEYSENKMASYEEQLTGLKKHIGELQAEFGEFENLTELHDMISEQHNKLLEVTKQSSEATEIIAQKEAQLEHYLQKVTEQDILLEERDEIIQTLTEKENEQAKIIGMLRNNVELRAHEDSILSQQLTEKSDKICNLTNQVQNKRTKILQLEKIVLNQQEQVQKFKINTMFHKDKIELLKKKLAEYQSYLQINKSFSRSSSEKLDSFLQLFENELKHIEPQLTKTESGNKSENRLTEDYRTTSDEKRTRNILTMPVKIVTNTKRVVNPIDDCFKQDSLDRKKAITKIEEHSAHSAKENDLQSAWFSTLDEHIAKELQREPKISISSYRDKNSKMYKFAGHKF